MKAVTFQGLKDAPVKEVDDPKIERSFRHDHPGDAYGDLRF
jgi:hypothetical protein